MSTEIKQDEFSAIAPIGATVNFCGQEIEITPLKVGQLPKFARAIRGIDLGKLTAVETGEMGVLMDLVADHGEQIIEATSIATGLSVGAIEKADVDELIVLALTVIRINADFFARRLTPAMRTAAGQAATLGDGQTA
jgi:hypothetical protein